MALRVRDLATENWIYENESLTGIGPLQSADKEVRLISCNRRWTETGDLLSISYKGMERPSIPRSSTIPSTFSHRTAPIYVLNRLLNAASY